MSPVLELDGVWKGYPDWSGRPRTLRGVLAGRDPLLERRGGERRWALREVSVALGAGESLGLIGHNGAGKSTLLRLASRLGRPTRGRIAVDPRAASLLSLGSSFDAQLTGSENAYTAALLWGLGRRDAARAVVPMLEFSGLGDFGRAPVRTYSEGMKLRLAFSILAVAEPSLLLLDEVLAVGDLAFRRRCDERIAELRSAGTSLVLASHSDDEIRRSCERVLWLHRGAVRALGPAEEVLERYERAAQHETLARTPVGAPRERDADGGHVLGETRFGSQEVRIERVVVGGTPGAESTVDSGGPLIVRTEFRAADGSVEDPLVSLQVRRAADGLVVLDASSRDDGLSLGRGVRAGAAEVAFDRLDLPAGRYELDVGVYERDWEYAYDYLHGAHVLHVRGPAAGRGALRPPRSWSAG